MSETTYLVCEDKPVEQRPRWLSLRKGSFGRSRDATSFNTRADADAAVQEWGGRVSVVKAVGSLDVFGGARSEMDKALATGSDDRRFKVGDGVHWSEGSDVAPGTVVSVSRSGNQITVSIDDAKLLNGVDSGQPDALHFAPGGFVGHTSGVQRHEFSQPAPGTRRFQTFSRRKAMEGLYKLQGTSARGSMRAWGILRHGRQSHYDYNF